MKPFDAVVLSTDLNPKYVQFWPYVARAWRKLYDDVQVHLAVVSEPSNIHLEHFPWAHIHFLKPLAGVPMPNQAKMARHFIAGSLADKMVVTVNDMDRLPLRKAFVDKLCGNRLPYTLTMVGAEHYVGPEKGKALVPYMTSESAIFSRLWGVGWHTWEQFIRSFIGLQKFDQKEDIANTIHHENPACFSDESVVRLRLSHVHVTVCHRPADHFPARNLCRSNWPKGAFSLDDYDDVHLPRPLHENQEAIYPLMRYLGVLE